MQIGMVGLGRMGSNMVRRLLHGGHSCAVYDLSPDARAALAAEGAVSAESLSALVAALPAPRTVWVMVPAGAITQSTIDQLAALLSPGDCVIDGGNSHFKDSVARAAALSAKGIGFIDAGTSGGIFGLERGYCLMVGGSEADVARNAPIFATLAPGAGSVERTPARAHGHGAETTAEQGWLHCGAAGSGHYVKMVHNGIEYGIMQAYAEGFALIDSADSATLAPDRQFKLDPAAIAELWRRGSVVSSWLLDLTADALAEAPDLAAYSPKVQDSGEGRWTIEAAMEQEVPAPVMTAALYERFRSRQDAPFADRLLSAMRFKFGGHVAPKAKG